MISRLLPVVSLTLLAFGTVPAQSDRLTWKAELRLRS